VECPRCHLPATPVDPACPGCAAPLVLPPDPPLSRLDHPLELDRRLRARDPSAPEPFFDASLAAWEAEPASVMDASSQPAEVMAWGESRPAMDLEPGEPCSLAGRALAAAIDAAVSFAVAAPPLAVAARMLPAGADLLGALAWPGAGLFALLSFAHATLGHALMGATVGQRMVGLRVAAADGLPPGLGRAALRASLALLGVLPPLFTRGRRTLHDRITGTWTIRAP
jgi:uncharacterized RDD family membrane protein YckC